MNNVKTMGNYLMEELVILAQHNKIIGDVRGMGLMIAIELVLDRQTKKQLTPIDIATISAYCTKLGLLVYTFKNGISLFPPLDLSVSEADFIVDIIEKSIHGFHEFER